MGSHGLPIPGARTSQVKILSTEYTEHSMTTTMTGPAGSSAVFLIRHNQKLVPKMSGTYKKDHPDASVGIGWIDSAPSDLDLGFDLTVRFPQGQGWQTLEFTLTW